MDHLCSTFYRNPENIFHILSPTVIKIGISMTSGKTFRKPQFASDINFVQQSKALSLLICKNYNTYPKWRTAEII